MPTAEYSRQYRIDNPDKYNVWDKQKRDKHKSRMLTDKEYADSYREKRRISERKRIDKIKQDPILYTKLRTRRNRAMLKWYHSKKQIDRILKNMKEKELIKSNKTQYFILN